MSAAAFHPAPVMQDIVYDLVGIGLGPSHIALAVAFHEERPTGRALFLDQRDAFAWHPALLLPASRMQISFLKDLATFRNPQSSYSFVSYLHACGRLVGFTNLGVWTPSRLEWASYLAWAAERLESDGFVEWSSRVIGIEPVFADGGALSLFKITRINPKTNALRVLYARNLSIAPGSTPFVPPIFSAVQPITQAIAHTATYLTTLARLPLDTATFKGRIAVIGGGQSSAEVFNDLMSKLPNAKIDMFFRASALVPADNSPFVNSRAFDPNMTDEFHGLNDHERADRLREFRRANYACVAPELIDSMYKLTYMQTVRGGDPQYRVVPNTEVTAVEPLENGSGIRLTVNSTLSSGPPPSTNNYAAVFLGTGYHRPASSLGFMSELASHYPALERFLDGQTPILQVDRDYSMQPATARSEEAKLFVLGFSEKTHGLSETLLSIGAVRAGEVVRTLAPLDGTCSPKLLASASGGIVRGRLQSFQPTGTLTPESESSPERRSIV
ncbi:L-lysine 6-monooxygenase (NADPH-requiring)-domain-containing protein [Auriculariales sp. MPI-PUGE-AT-0066]|nr:L-lysine 6-monooxygenase (NADPH-requiring)-domain-containing protein [Auriculariales sp. MPI-PUGE-AT-0066]